MFIIKRKEFNLPNLISFFRILMIIPFIKYMMGELYIEAGFILLICAISDILDGFLARILHQETSLGRILDPVADKLTIISVMICIGLKFSKMIVFMIIFIVKEIIMLIAGINLIKENKKLMKSKWYGKITTAGFYFSIIIIVTFKAFWGVEDEFLNSTLMTLTSLLMFYALLRYSADFIKIKKEIKKW